MLLLSSALVVRAVARANHSLPSYFFKKKLFSVKLVFRHLNMDLAIFFNVILSDLRQKT